ncbi:unnamed protein product [Callosobruchus maculatus]|uniref:Uncharacterized protein n=1 Tax=Callosobruchus maculatus TaxID=64391 RepID=A0A653DWC3_CALMS|nr:unnamed protein product [Callosobruchus maculatus]
MFRAVLKVTMEFFNPFFLFYIFILLYVVTCQETTTERTIDRVLVGEEIKVPGHRHFDY